MWGRTMVSGQSVVDIFKPWAYLVCTVSLLGVYFAKCELQSLSNQDNNGNENVKEQLVL